MLKCFKLSLTSKELLYPHNNNNNNDGNKIITVIIINRIIKF